jgi:outer membrane protein assembly factor BamA
MAVPIKFSLFRPQAEDVRVTGSFNGWDEQGIRMSKDEKGAWSVAVPIEPGKVLYKFYIDGEWGPDPDVAETVDDGKGGRATLFVVKAPEAKFTFRAGEAMKEKKGTDFSPGVDYNRVDGLYLASLISNESNSYPMPQFYLEGGYSWKRDRWLYTVEIDQPLLPARILSLGGSFYDKTDTYDKEIISDGENFVSSAFVKRDYRDYFDHRGAYCFAAFRPFKGNTFKITYTSDEYRPLYTRAHSAIFRRHDEFAPNPHNPALEDPFDRARQNAYQIGHDPVTGLRIEGLDLIAIKSMGASYEFDMRDCRECPSTGLLAKLEGEWAGRDFGGDLDYSRYVADLRFFNRLTPRQRYAIRIKAGAMDVPPRASCPCVPGPQYFFPKQFYVGGIGTLPGYDYKEFRGTHMLLVNWEYFVALKGNSGIVFFADGGDARGKGESTSDVLDAMKFKYDAGVGFRVESSDDHIITIGVAKRLDDTDEPMLITMRASRPF